MKRTIPQNSALHLYCEWVAHALDEGGLDMREVIRVPIRPTKELVKETMVRPVMEAMFPDVHSTADLTTGQMVELYETLNRALGERLGIHVPWPDEFSRMADAQAKKQATQ